MNCFLKAAKDKQSFNTTKVRFGMNVPFDHKETMFDANNSNTNWKDDEILELK